MPASRLSRRHAIPFAHASIPPSYRAAARQLLAARVAVLDRKALDVAARPPELSWTADHHALGLVRVHGDQRPGSDRADYGWSRPMRL
ncbi:hypothetical protein ACQP0C_30030 [Nocardia sp. CA-129566]|uniref:hypothetical protein n=1 Tax=Nocardia sp. CA-129566 TaxID=3239976 RepID=UPI003D98F7DB